VEGIALTDDLFIGISTTGNRQSIINVFTAAKQPGGKKIGLSGRDGGQMTDACDLNIVVPSWVAAHFQEAYILTGDILCLAVINFFQKHCWLYSGSYKRS
jgi:D-sedoheptulose 7-phosphate isomerase